MGIGEDWHANNHTTLTYASATGGGCDILTEFNYELGREEFFLQTRFRFNGFVTMKKMVVVFLIVVMVAGLSFAQDGQNCLDQVAHSLGKIILFEDRMERYARLGGNPRSAEKHMRLIEAEFAVIRQNLDVEKHIEFLWSIMARSGFGSHYSERFAELIHNCCHDVFLDAIDQYLTTGHLKNNTTRHKANFIKNALEDLNK